MRHRALALACACLWLSTAVVSAVGAQEPADAVRIEDCGWTAALIFENDVLWIDDSDRHYTNGIQLFFHAGEGRVWGWLRRLSRATVIRDPDTLLNMRVSLGQNLYTPENLKTDELIQDDRPYAGWLHADLGVTGLKDRDLSVFELSLGMVGPSAGGEALQDWFHEIIDSPDPAGWEHQLNDELAVLVAYQRSWGGILRPSPVPLLGGLGLAWDAIPQLDVNLGNVFTHAGAGAMVRLGSRLEQDLGPPRIRPSPPGAVFPATDRRLQWYLFATGSGRLVLRNIFLDGNTFADSHSVDKNSLVGDLSLGVAVAALGLRLSFTHTMRSPEFDGQRRPDHFGSVTIAYSR